MYASSNIGLTIQKIKKVKKFVTAGQLNQLKRDLQSAVSTFLPYSIYHSGRSASGDDFYCGTNITPSDPLLKKWFRNPKSNLPPPKTL